MKIQTIDVTAKEWFDKINGNSYHAVQITLNYGMENQQTIYCPFTYGYGGMYEQTAYEAIKKAYPKLVGAWYGLYAMCEHNSIILRCNKIKNCKKAEVKEFGGGI